MINSRIETAVFAFADLVALVIAYLLHVVEGEEREAQAAADAGVEAHHKPILLRIRKASA